MSTLPGGAEAHWSQALDELRACPEGVDYGAEYPDLLTSWNACKRGDWVLWLAARLALDSGRRQRVVATLCHVARLGYALLPEEELRPRSTLALCDRWAATPESVSFPTLRRAAGTAASAAQALGVGTAAAAVAEAAAAVGRCAGAAASRRFEILPTGAHGVDRWRVAWANAATQPATWIAAARSVAAWNETHDKAAAETAAIQAYAESADLVRHHLPADKALGSLLHSGVRSPMRSTR